MRVRGLIFLATLVLATGSAFAASDPAKAAADAWRQAHERQILDELSGFVSLPDVAANIADVDANAARLEEMLRTRGFAVRLLRASPGTPATVFGELKVPGAKRTVLYYAHYDGQPVGQRGWASPPFTPTIRSGRLGAEGVHDVDWRAAPGPANTDWRLYARAAADDKVTIEALLAAMDALKAADLKPSVNIKLYYEGEEEQGSPHIATIVAANRDLLKTDLIVMGDGPMHQSGRQMVNFGSRGYLGARMTVFGPLRPLHDGHYGSWAPSPAVEIARLIASLRDDSGHILIPHFYDAVRPPTPAEKAALAALPSVEEPLAHDFGIVPITRGRLADSYFRPTLNVRAIHVGDEGPNAANAVATQASASIDFRLTPGETPGDVKALTEHYLASQGWLIVNFPPNLATRLANPKILLLIWDEGSSMPVRTDIEAPAAKASVAAIQRVEREPVLELPMVGASSGIAAVVTGLNAPMVGVSIANYDDNQHAENENIRLGNLWDGIDVYAALLSELDW
ncbi:MAG TPA: M20/M25/M40 family metallo-hydrolase [Caulobacteraceae bacterium]|jgi:acetylornithine deacetylase/succinyl-diaminopimelate desuccinylase-like protein